MKIPKQDLSRCISIAQNISSIYQTRILGGQHSKRSIDILLEVCGQQTNRQIEVYKGEGDINNRWLYGTCLISDHKAEILYAHHLNLCWERFTVCKEAFHVALDQDEYRTTAIFNLIEEILLHFPNDDSEPTQPVVSEFLAEVAAMEFMLPYHEREVILQNATPAMTIAEQYKIPCLLVERYLSKDYMTNLKP